MIEKNVLNTDLTGKVAVVTGASGVLCSQFSIALARAGAKVAMLSRNAENSRPFVEQIVSEGGIAKAYSCNVLDKARCAEVAEEIKKDFGPCDILINGAGALCTGTKESDLDAVELIMSRECQTHIGSVFFGAGDSLSPIDAKIMRVIYQTKYSKKAE